MCLRHQLSVLELPPLLELLQDSNLPPPPPPPQAIVSSSGMGRDVHSSMLSIRYFLCWPRRRPPSKVSWRRVSERLVVACYMPEPCKFSSLDKVPRRRVSERLSWRVTCLNHASSRLLTRCPEGVFRRGCRGVWHAWTMQVLVSWRRSTTELYPQARHDTWRYSA